MSGMPSRPEIFQPALPLRGVTEVGMLLLVLLLISTRTPLAGSDKGIKTTPQTA